MMFVVAWRICGVFTQKYGNKYADAIYHNILYDIDYKIKRGLF